MKKYLFAGFVVAGFMAGISGCTKDHTQLAVIDTNGCDTVGNTYNGKIKTIMETYCSQTPSGACHDAGTAEKNVVTDSYAGAKNAFQNQNALCYAQHNCTPGMPYTQAAMPDSILKRIQCWIGAGYPEN